MRFEIVSNWHDPDGKFGYEEIAKLTVPNIQAYAARHGYGYRACSHPGHFGKISALLESWDDADWLWWIDTDAIVTNRTIRLEDLAKHGDVVLTCDGNGINSGSMIFRTIPEVRRTLVEMLNNRSVFDFPPWHDQNAFAYKLWGISDRVRVIHKRRLNSYPSDWQRGDFVLHWPGMPNHERIKLIERHLIRNEPIDVL